VEEEKEDEEGSAPAPKTKGKKTRGSRLNPATTRRWRLLPRPRARRPRDI